jgi:hypothetical protein
MYICYQLVVFLTQLKKFSLFCIVVLFEYQTNNTVVSAGNCWSMTSFQQRTMFGLGGLEVLSTLCFEVLNSLKGLVLL